MNICIFSDLHAHNFQMFSKINEQGINTRFDSICKVLIDIKEFVRSNKIDTTIFAGDFYHSFSSVENDVLNITHNILKDWPGEFIYIAGNHDLKSKIEYADHSVSSALFKSIGDNFHYLNNSMHKLSDGTTIYGIGYKKDRDFLKSEFAKANIFVGHQMVKNSKVKNGIDIPKNIKDLYDLMIFGDVHAYEQYDNILIPGAPLQHSFGDENEHKHVHIYNTITKRLSLYEIDSPKFITLEDASLLSKYDKVNYYRIINSKSKVKVENDNVILQDKVKQEFRESNLNLRMSGEEIVTEYCKIQKCEDVNTINKGIEIIKTCTTKFSVPKNYIIKNIEVENFGSIQKKISFDFKEDVCLVLGTNGVGKTTLFEAIFWGLFDETTKGLSANDVVNDTVNKDCYVKMTLADEDNNNTIIIHRYRKHSEFGNDFYFTINDTKINREKISETQKELNALLGTSPLFFKNTNYFSQENFEFFSSLSDSSQKEICNSLLPLDIFEQAAGKAKAKIDIIDKDKAIAESELIKNKASLEELNNTIIVLKAEADKWLQNNKNDIQVTHGKIDIVSESIAEITPQIQIKQAELSNHKSILNSLFSKKNVAVDTKEFDDKITELSKRVYDESLKLLEANKLVESEELAYSNGRQIRDNYIFKANANVAKLKSRHSTIASANEEYLKNIMTLQAGKCTYCNQAISDDKTKVLIEDLSNKITANKQESENLDKEIADCLKGLEDCTNQFITVESNYNSNIVIQKAKKEDINKRVTEYRISINNIENEKAHYISMQTKDIDNDIRQVSQAITFCEKELSEFLSKSNNLSIQHDSFKRLIADLEKAINPFILNLSSSEERLKLANEKIEHFNEKILFLQSEKDSLLFWVKGFSNQGIVSYLLDAFAKRFTELFNNYLLTVSLGKFTGCLQTQKQLASGEYREKFSFTIYIEGKKRNYKALSGGQKARINMATVIVLNELIREYYGLTRQPFGVLILDELFTYLDDAGIESIFDALNKFMINTSVYVVTHKKEIQNFFNKCINVQLTENGTIYQE